MEDDAWRALLQPWSSMRPPIPRRGFTYVEVLVALTVMVILAAVITPSLLGVLDQQRVDRGRAQLEQIVGFLETFKANTTRYPFQLKHLAEPIVASDPLYLSSCKAQYTAGQVGNWAGPYMNRLVPPSGLPLALGLANDTLVRTPQTGGPGTLQIRLLNVLEGDALILDEDIDGVVDAAQGTIRYGAAVDGFVTLFYTLPVNNC